MSALVVKIGGSLWRSPLLARWIAALRAFPGPLTIVPGGGPFADAVRAAQPPMGFSDRAAHKMAILAMEQYGLALVDKFEGLESAASPKEAGAVHARRNIAVWRPSAMAPRLNVAASWDVTSDSLSAVYAHESGAARLLLIKSVDVDAAPDLGGLVDPRFASHAAGLDVFIAGPGALDGAREILARGGVAGSRVSLASSSRKIAS
jgi:5-(aminomethyl)-3-furanmethanol phosphate kinase